MLKNAKHFVYIDLCMPEPPAEKDVFGAMSCCNLTKRFIIVSQAANISIRLIFDASSSILISAAGIPVNPSALRMLFSSDISTPTFNTNEKLLLPNQIQNGLCEECVFFSKPVYSKLLQMDRTKIIRMISILVC